MGQRRGWMMSTNPFWRSLEGGLLRAPPAQLSAQAQAAWAQQRRVALAALALACQVLTTSTLFFVAQGAPPPPPPPGGLVMQHLSNWMLGAPAAHGPDIGGGCCWTQVVEGACESSVHHDVRLVSQIGGQGPVHGSGMHWGRQQPKHQLYGLGGALEEAVSGPKSSEQGRHDSFSWSAERSYAFCNATLNRSCVHPRSGYYRSFSLSMRVS